MTQPEESKASQILRRAKALDVEEGSQYIDDACAGDAELKGEVLRLMEDEASSSFEGLGALSPWDEGGARPMEPARDGEWVGAFRIVRTIGSGGMGIVYEAEQEFPSRRVALKVLPASLGRPAAAQRFHTEVQLLARIDHPGVARMLEAGVHTGGDGHEQPYFAMEFVPDASDLTRWGKSKPLAERLEVFIRICDAVQHGHNQGVVHRDLKPANVLVGRGDTPKVIDFGVAGVVEDDEGSPQTRATQAGDIVGTLQYMAPEQLEGALHVDTRTDIYALGLLLYELVSGVPPFNLDGRSISDIVMIIRDETLSREIPALKKLPEDLWWIILRATEKEPARRYGTASELAADLRRFLQGRPVEAARPSRMYAFKKLVQRNKSATAAVAAVLVSVVVGTIVSVMAMLEAAREADNFKAINGVLTGMFQDVRPYSGGANLPAVKLLDRAAERVATFTDRPDLEADLRRTLAKSYAYLGHDSAAAEQGTRALALRGEMTPAEEADAARWLAESLIRANRLDDAQAILDRFDETWIQKTPGVPETTRLMLGQAATRLLHSRGASEEAAERLEALVMEAEALLETSPTVENGEATLRSLETTLFLALMGAGRHSEAERRLRNTLERVESARSDGEVVGTDVLLSLKAELAKSLILQQRFRDGIDVLEEILPDAVRVYGEAHSNTLVMMNDLASAYTSTDGALRAVPILEEVLRVREERDGADHPDTIIAHLSLAKARAEIGDDEGEELLRASVETRARVYGRDDPRTLFAVSMLCGFLRTEGRLEEAEPLHVDLHERSQRVFRVDEVERYRGGAALGLLRLKQGRLEEAIALMKPAFRGYQRYADEGDTDVLALASNLAGSLGEQGRFGEAIEVFTEVLVKMRTKLDPGDRRIATLLVSIGALHGRQGEMTMCLRKLREAREWADAHLDEADSQRLSIYESNGYQLVQMGRATEAIPVYEELMRAAELHGRLDAVQRSTFELGFARCLLAAGEHQRGVEAMETVIEMERTRLGDKDPGWIEQLEAELAEAKLQASR